MLTLLITFTAAGLLAACLGLPLMLRRIPPNRFYGFRTPATLRDPEIWYPANAFAGRLLLVWGILCALVAGFAYLWPGIEKPIYVALNFGAIVGGALVMVLACLRALGGIKADRNQEQGNAYRERRRAERKKEPSA